jgi:hypothetical protein
MFPRGLKNLPVFLAPLSKSSGGCPLKSLFEGTTEKEYNHYNMVIRGAKEVQD